jgi:ATP-dependent DNA helicase RecQ
VTAVPSLLHPELVPDFAERLAKTIGLPYSQALKVVKKTKEQSTLENSRQQYLNVQGSLDVDHGSARPGSVLLVDGLADSKWTLHEAGKSLRRAGTSAVVPLVIASGGFVS